MPYQTIDCYSAEDFFNIFSNYENNKNNKIFLLFEGSIVPETNKSWCPDCTNSWPIINEALEEISSNNNNIILIKTHLEREIYRNPNFILRLDNRIKLSCVPILIEYKNDIENELEKYNKKLLDYECLDIKKVQKFFNL